MKGPAVFEPITQKDTMDCGVACLAMLLGLPYPVVREGTTKVLHAQGGLVIKQFIAIAKKFGETLDYEVFDEDEHEIGILFLTLKKGVGHAVVYINGTVWNTGSGTLWADLDTFLETYGYKVHGILVKKGES